MQRNGKVAVKTTKVVSGNNKAVVSKITATSNGVDSQNIEEPQGLTYYNPDGIQNAQNRLWEKDSNYMKWKNNCTYVEYCKIRKYLKWRKDNNYRNDKDFKKYLYWKHTNYTDHKHDNYYYNDYCVFKRCYDTLDHEIYRAWKKWRGNKQQFKEDNKDYHKYRKNGVQSSIAVIKTDDDKPQYLEKATTVKNRNYIDFKKNATISDFIDYRNYQNWEIHAAKHHIDIGNSKKYQKFVDEIGSHDHEALNDEFEAWKNLNSRDDYNEWHKYWMWKKNFKYYQNHGKKYNPHQGHDANNSISDSSSDDSDSEDNASENNKDNLIQVLNLDGLSCNKKNNKGKDKAASKDEDDLDIFSDDISYEINRHANDDDEYGDMDAIARRELYRPTLKQQRAQSRGGN